MLANLKTQTAKETDSRQTNLCIVISIKIQAGSRALVAYA
jgi:hypothetical protein